MTNSVDRLTSLARSGALRLVYVIGVARSNSTVVCRLLGQRLDGAVYEPAMPVTRTPLLHWAEIILSAYEQARATRPGSAPVALAVKDLSLFVSEPIFQFVRAHAAEIVLTIRDPLHQFPSLVNQMKHEFSVRNRIDAVLRNPIEVGWLAWYMLKLAPGWVRATQQLNGRNPLEIPLAAIGGWNLKSWSNIARHAAELGDRVTILDAGLMRAFPDEASAILQAIAHRVAPHSPGSNLEIAAHTRMLPRSKWANEALASTTIKPAGPVVARVPKGPFETRLLAEVQPAYTNLFTSPQNALLPLAQAHTAAPELTQMRHLLETR